MSNKVYKGDLFNEDIKNEFISQYSESTQKTLVRIFKVSFEVENELKKDLYEFDRNQLRMLLYLYMPTTAHSSKQNVSWISKYIDWAIEEGYFNHLNPLDNITEDWKVQFVQRVKKYWTYEEIEKIINQRRNAQDAVIVSLLFNGVRGNANSEILNLTKSDVDANLNMLHLVDDEGSKRSITVDERCIKLCLEALRETEYEKMNGNASPDIKSPMANLVINEYVVKSANTQTQHLNEAEKNIVHRRLSKIANEIEEPCFTPLNIVKSGMLYMAYELYKVTGKLDKEECNTISERFDIKKIKVNDKVEFNYLRHKNEFLNLETINEVYNVDLK